MFQSLFISIFFVVLISCNTNKQVKKGNAVTSIQLFKESGDLMIKGFISEASGSDSSKMYYEQAIKKFLAAYYSDTSNMELAIYLPDLYNKLKKFDSSSLWRLRLSGDSIKPQQRTEP